MTGPSKAKTRLVTAPVEVITTTITSWGCSSSTSTWRTVEDSGGGAVTMPSRFVTWAIDVGQAAEGGVDLAPHLGLVEGPPDHRRRARGRVADQQRVHVVAVAPVGRDPARRGVGVVEEAQLLEARQLVAHRRRGEVDALAAGDVLAAHRRAGGDVLLDDRAQDQLLARLEGRDRRAVGHAYSMSSWRMAFCTKRPSRVRATASVAGPQQARRREPAERLGVVGRPGPGEVEALAPAAGPASSARGAGRRASSGSTRARRLAPLGQRRDVGRQRRAVAPAPAGGGADGADRRGPGSRRRPSRPGCGGTRGRAGRSWPSRTSGSPRPRARRRCAGRRRRPRPRRAPAGRAGPAPSPASARARTRRRGPGPSASASARSASRSAGVWPGMPKIRSIERSSNPAARAQPTTSRACCGVAARSSAASRCRLERLHPHRQPCHAHRAQLPRAPGGRPSRGWPRCSPRRRSARRGRIASSRRRRRRGRIRVGVPPPR